MAFPRFRLLEPWRTRALWLSVGFNVFAAATLAAPLLGPFVRPPHPPPPPGPPSFERVVARMARHMQAPDAERFRQAMDQERPWYERSRTRLDEARAEVARAFGRPDYDPAAARAALATMQDRLRETSARFDDSLAAALGTVSPDGRARLADAMGPHRP